MFTDRWLTLGIGNHVKLKRCHAAVALKGLGLCDLLKDKIAVTWEDRHFICASASVSYLIKLPLHPQTVLKMSDANTNHIKRAIMKYSASV